MSTMKRRWRDIGIQKFTHHTKTEKIENVMANCCAKEKDGKPMLMRKAGAVARRPGYILSKELFTCSSH
jgi:hypothetical protein